MALNLTIRNETDADRRAVEELTREAFWNLYVPGCNEHYLVNVLRTHPDFIPELDFVAEYEGHIIGSILYAKSSVVDVKDPSRTFGTVSFGPVSVLPQYQRMGVGSALIRHSLQKARQIGYPAVIILGHPANYCMHGFKNGKDAGVCDGEGRYPYGLLALELREGVFKGGVWKYVPSDVYNLDETKAAVFDRGFTPLPKQYRHTQEEFLIACRAYLA